MCIKRVRIFSLVTTGLFVSTAQSANNELFNLSLEELLNIKVSTGALTDTSAKDSLSAITLIRQDQIQYSSAKNLSSLLEQYVPGLQVMAHSEGDKIGLRGHIAAENYKLLLLVNGKNITNMVYEGAILELDQWDLNDIEQVEVVRGPGSVTYGTGAIAGVINIITKSATTVEQGVEFNLSANDSYRSRGGNIQYADSSQDLAWYSFLSFRETDGLENPDHFLMGYAGDGDNRFPSRDESAAFRQQDYLADTFSRPQIKAHIDVSYKDNLNVWARYTQSGQSHHFLPQVEVTSGNSKQIENGRQVGLRSFIGSVSYKHDLNEYSRLSSDLTYDNQEYIRWFAQNPESQWESSDNIKDYAFSQQRIVASLLYSYRGEKTEVITGFEYSNIHVGAPWHKSDDHILIREGVNLISSFENSVYTQDPTLNGKPNSENSIAVGSGLKLDTYSHLIEASYQLSEPLKIAYSHRIDNSDLTSTMYSPRLSLVSKVDEKNSITVTAQKASRMMPIRAQYLLNAVYTDSDRDEYESIEGIEMAYRTQSIENTSLDFRLFYNAIHAVGFTGQELRFLGDFELAGLDVELNYKHENLDFTFSHSHINLLNMNMNDELKSGGNKNNISFSDYFFNTRTEIPLTLEGYGSGLNNISENISKFTLTANFLDNKLITQLNGQIYWDFDGSYDEMRMYQTAYDRFEVTSLSEAQQQAFSLQKGGFENERDLLDKEGVFDFEYSLNMSIGYYWRFNQNTKMSVSFFIDNITGSKNIYYVSTGSSRAYPERLKYLEQPTTIGINFSLSY